MGAGDSPVSEAEDLPCFRYRPGSVAGGAIRASPEACACCGHTSGWSCTATFYIAHEIDGRLCPSMPKT